MVLCIKKKRKEDMLRLEFENYSEPEAKLGFRVQKRAQHWEHILLFRANTVLKLLHLSKIGLQKGNFESWKIKKESVSCRDKRLHFDFVLLSFCLLVWEEESARFFSSSTWVFACFFVQCHGGVWIFRSRSEKHTSSSSLLLFAH